jgi:hypothetical protein
MSSPALFNLAMTFAVTVLVSALFHWLAWRNPKSHASFTLFGTAKLSSVLYLVSGLCLVAIAFLYLDKGGCRPCSATRSAVGYLIPLVLGSMLLSVALKSWGAGRGS